MSVSRIEIEPALPAPPTVATRPTGGGSAPAGGKAGGRAAAGNMEAPALPASRPGAIRGSGAIASGAVLAYSLALAHVGSKLAEAEAQNLKRGWEVLVSWWRESWGSSDGNGPPRPAARTNTKRYASTP